MPPKKKKRNGKDTNGAGKISTNSNDNGNGGDAAGDGTGGNGNVGETVGAGNSTSKKKGKKKGGAAKGKSFQCDIFNDAAMENAYYCCHNVQDVLKSRGFAWPEAQKKKKKGKR